MCGRYALGVNAEELYDGIEARLPELFQRGRPRWERPQDHRANYNVAPRSRGVVIRRGLDDGQPMLETMQWGLIPHWTKHPPTGGLNTINARSESLIDPSSGGMWHALKGYKRCIVPAQGYYEWQKKASSKVAHFTRLPLKPITKNTPIPTNTSPPLIFFAGLYDIVTYLSPVESRFRPSHTEEEDDPSSPQKEKDTREPYPTGNPLPLSTFTILTTTPTKDLSWLHDRMPCILNSWEEIQKWLDLGETPKGWEEWKGGTGDLLHGLAGLDCYPVPPEVGKIGTNSPTFIQPVSERSDGIKSFFQKQHPSPAKTTSKKAEGSTPLKRAVKSDSKEGIKSDISGDAEENLGDDSNAPNPGVKAEAKHEDEGGLNEANKPSPITTGKRKRSEKEEKMEIDDVKPTESSKEGERKGGHQTKVVRRDGNSDKTQPAITSFFKSPQKDQVLPTPNTRGTKGSRRGRGTK